MRLLLTLVITLAPAFAQQLHPTAAKPGADVDLSLKVDYWKKRARAAEEALQNAASQTATQKYHSEQAQRYASDARESLAALNKACIDSGGKPGNDEETGEPTCAPKPPDPVKAK